MPVQLTLYGAVPPVAVITPDPLLPPLHDTLVEVFVAVSTVGSVIVTVVVAVHPLASVTVML